MISQICTDCKLKKERYDNIQLKNNNIRVIHGTAGHLYICISLLHDHVAGFISGLFPRYMSCVQSLMEVSSKKAQRKDTERVEIRL